MCFCFVFFAGDTSSEDGTSAALLSAVIYFNFRGRFRFPARIQILRTAGFCEGFKHSRESCENRQEVFACMAGCITKPQDKTKKHRTGRLLPSYARLRQEVSWQHPQCKLPNWGPVSQLDESRGDAAQVRTRCTNRPNQLFRVLRNLAADGLFFM